LRLSDLIASFIAEAVEKAGGIVELQRNELASKLGCVPSQINYVIASRFTPENGYLVESRRGGGGYIRVMRITMGKHEFLMHVVNSIGQDIDTASARAIAVNLFNREIISERELKMLLAALSETALAPVSPSERSSVRAQIFKSMLVSLLN